MVTEARPALLTGLTSGAAAHRLRRRDRTSCRRATPVGRPAIRAPARALRHAVMHGCAGALAFVADLPQLGVAIAVVIVVNALFAFAQQAGPGGRPSGCGPCCPAR